MLLLGGADDLAVLLGEVARVEPHQARAEVGRHDFGVCANQLAQFGEAGAAASIDLGDKFVDALLSQRPALEQDLVLAAKIIVERGLGDVQPFGDLVERGAMIALLEKQLHGGSQHGFALLVARAAAAFERHPWRGIGRRVSCIHVHRPRAWR